MNNHLAWGPPASVADYFLTPLSSFMANCFSRQIHNPETFLMDSYLNVNITLILTAWLGGLLKLKITKDKNRMSAIPRVYHHARNCPKGTPGKHVLTYDDPSIWFKAILCKQGK
jgi:hypothetical protein